MPRTYHHLSLAERDTIMRMRDRRMSVGTIAAELARHPATIYRELQRNFFHDDDAYFRRYFGRVAHGKARARRARGGRVMRNRMLASHITDRFVQCWSPEQIAKHLRLNGTGTTTVSHETIYQFVYGPEGRQAGLWRHLPRQRKSRRRRYARKPRGLRIPLANTNAQRPKDIAERVEFGQWEGNLIAFRKEFGRDRTASSRPSPGASTEYHL